MASKKFNIDGRELSIYQLSNQELMERKDDEDVKNEIIRRFGYDCVPECGEDEDILFAKNFSRFVNGTLCSSKKVAEQMAMEHRYLQEQMFKVCYEYIKKLSENYEKGCYDGRNEYACKMANEMHKAYIEATKIY